MLSLLVAKQALKDDFFIRGDTPISSRMFFVQGACCLFIFLVFKLRVKRILVHFYFQLFRLYLHCRCTASVCGRKSGNIP